MQTTSTLIKKEERSLADRGLNDKSFFHATFLDGSQSHEADTNWSDMSTLSHVKYKGGMKSVMLSKHPLKHIHINHNTQFVKLDVPAGHSVYQAVRAETLFIPNQAKQTRITGRCVGFVKDGEVVQEVLINAHNDSITGWKK
jgi:hypothetical protein